MFVSICLASEWVSSQAIQCHAADRPNVLIFFVDDMGWKDSSTYGSEFYETPNLDRFADGGLRFTQAYAMPLCSPSRACLMTGRHAGARMHMHQAITGASKAEPVVPSKANPNHPMLWPESRSHLPRSEVTIAESFQAAGYRTHFLGKWHLGNGPQYAPIRQGFDTQLAVGGAGPGPSYFAPYSRLVGLNNAPEGEYICDRLTDETINLLDETPEQPFFILLAHFNVHSPYQAPEKLIAKYKAKAESLPVDATQRHAIMGAMIEAMDTSLGQVLDALDEKELADSTVVVFASDNGGVHWVNGKKGQVDAEVPITSNAPLRGGKASQTEGGVRIPMVVRWPKHVPVGKSEHLTHLMDIYPTLASACDVTIPNETPMDGINAWAQWSGKTAEPARDVIYEHFPRRKTLVGTPGASFVRKGDWKLVRVWGDGDNRENRHELYNLANDIGEASDISAMHQDRVKAMSQMLDRWLSETGALLPTPNPAYKE